MKFHLGQSLLFIVTIIAFTSCKKTNTVYPTDPQTPSPSPLTRIKTATVSGMFTTTYVYDNQWRLIRTESQTDETIKIAYTNTTVSVSHYSDPNRTQLKWTDNYDLDANGLVTTKKNSTAPNDLTVYNFTTDKQLSAFNYVAFEPNEEHHWAIQYHYGNDNVLDSVSGSHILNGGAPQNFVAYYDEYYTNKPNTITNENYGEGFLGKTSVNPLKKYRVVENNSTTTYSYTFEYDAQNRIIKQTQTITGVVPAIDPIVTTYTYY